MEKNKYLGLPLGIIILIAGALVEISREIYSYFSQNNLFFGFYLTGTIFNIVNSILLLFSILVIYTLVSLNFNMIKIVTGYYCLMIINYLLVVVNSVTLSAIMHTNTYQIITIHAIGIMLFLLTIWYLFEKRTLFLQKKDDNKSFDGVFSVLYLSFFVLIIILSIIFLAIG